MIPIGRMNKSVALQRATRAVTTEGYTDAWVTYATTRAAVEPASPARVEQYVGATVTTPVSHLVTIWHRESRPKPTDDPGVTGLIHSADRVLYRDRALYIAGMQNPREDDRTLILACEERAA